MKIFISLVIIFYLSVPVSSMEKSQALDDAVMPFDMPQIAEPVIPDAVFNILDYGAVNDSRTDNTQAIARTIDACANAGGGKIVIPAGIWHTAPIHFKSNINLHIKQGALLLFSPDFDQYPLIHSSFEGTDQVRCTSPINAVNVENIAITGKGIIDGSGQAWRPVKRFKMTDRQWRQLVTSGGVVNERGDIWWPSSGALHGASILETIDDSAPLEAYLPARDFLRPVMVRLVNCRRVLLDGPVFQNSPAWNIHPLLCEDVIIRNITVRNPWFSQNGDGLDLESCKNVLVTDCAFDVGDDAICLKSGRDEFGRERGVPSENIVIKNCTVYHGHGGVTTGSEMSGGVRNVWVSDCLFMGTDIGLRFKSMRGRGGVVEDMYFNNINMTGIQNEAILFDLFYESSESDAPLPQVDESTPVFKNISFTNITSLDAGTSVYLRGLPEKAIENISFANMLMYSEQGVACSYVDNIDFTAIQLYTKEEPAIRIHQSRDIDFDLTGPIPASTPLIKVTGSASQNIRLNGPGLQHHQPTIDYGRETRNDAVRVGMTE